MTANRKVYLSEVPLLFPTLVTGAGIAAGTHVSSAAAWIAALIGGCGAFLMFRRRKPRYGIWLMFAVVGILVGRAALPTRIGQAREMAVEGDVVESKDFGESYRLVVSSGGGNFLMWVDDVDGEIIEGDRIRARGVAVPPDYDGTVPDEITNRGFLVSRGIYARLEGVEGFRIVEEAEGLKSWPARCRRWLGGQLLHCGLSQRSEQFMQAVLLGEMNLDWEVRDDFSRSGLSHLLALSGTHVGIIFMIVALLFFPFTLIGKGRTGSIVTLMLLWIYALVTGLSPSVVRAVVMVSFVIGGKLLGRDSNSLNSLCGAALLILLFSPMTLFDIGFRLSFLAVAGILLFLPILLAPILKLTAGRLHWIVKMAGILLLPVGAMITTAPMVLYHFHIFPVWFILSNLPAGFLLPLIMSGGVALLLLAVAGIRVEWLSAAINRLTDTLMEIGERVAEMQPEGMDALYPSPGVVILTYGVLIFLWLAWNNRRRVFLYSAGVTALAATGFLFVGQGVYPDRETYEWRTAHSFNLLHRDGCDAVIVTDAPAKYHDALLATARWRLKDYLGRRGARLTGVCSDSLTMPGIVVSKGEWNVGGRRYLLLSDRFVPSSVDSIRAAEGLSASGESGEGGWDVVVLSRGFKGDAAEVAGQFPDAEIVPSPSLYAPLRRDAMHRLLIFQGREASRAAEDRE